TDDTVLVERLGFPVKIIEGAYENIKITTPEDIVLAEAFISVGYGNYRR
ncbi:MAG TPA: 2-C-methyl-D-erythritol 4-phosphate cytidylyltransferase, partial [Tepidanaerobacteraceae bacterium]|nr:2-C-methyl-D-erythritol 4-phosphate cytidylyltransferase [Tepidanaerobacteraceae bacterium]